MSTPLPKAPSAVQKVLDYLQVKTAAELRGMTKSSVIEVPYVGESKAREVLRWRNAILSLLSEAPVPSEAPLTGIPGSRFFTTAVERLRAVADDRGGETFCEVIVEAFEDLGLTFLVLIEPGTRASLRTEAERYGHSHNWLATRLRHLMDILRYHWRDECRRMLTPISKDTWLMEAGDVDDLEALVIAHIGVPCALNGVSMAPTKPGGPYDGKRVVTTASWRVVRRDFKNATKDIVYLLESDVEHLCSVMPGFRVLLEESWEWEDHPEQGPRWLNPAMSVYHTVYEVLRDATHGLSMVDLKATLWDQHRVKLGHNQLREWLRWNAVILDRSIYQCPQNIPVPRNRLAAVQAFATRTVLDADGPVDIGWLCEEVRRNFPHGTSALEPGHVLWLVRQNEDVTVKGNKVFRASWRGETRSHREIVIQTLKEHKEPLTLLAILDRIPARNRPTNAYAKWVLDNDARVKRAYGGTYEYVR